MRVTHGATSVAVYTHVSYIRELRVNQTKSPSGRESSEFFGFHWSQSELQLTRTDECYEISLSINLFLSYLLFIDYTNVSFEIDSLSF